MASPIAPLLQEPFSGANDVGGNPPSPMQDPFASTGSLPLTGAPPPAPSGAPVSDPSPLMGFPGSIIQSREADELKMSEASRKQMEIADKASSGFWPTALAVTAAVLKGDMRPAMQLQQMKAQTAFTKAVAPDMLKIERLTQAGKFDDAEMLMSSVVAASGERAPQLAQFLQQRSKRISDMQQDVRNIRSTVHILEAAGTGEKDHPNYKAFKGLEKLSREGTPISNDYAKEILGKVFGIHFQNIGERLVATGMATGVSRVESVPQVYRVETLQADPFAQQVAGDFGVGLPEMAAVLNRDQDVQAQGRMIGRDSPEANAIRQAYIASRGKAGALALAGKVPDPTPDLVEELSKFLSPEDIALKRWGSTQAEAAQNLNIAQKLREIRRTDQVGANTTADILAKARSDPNALAGQAIFDSDPNSETFGVLRPLHTIAQVVESGGKLNVTDTATHQKTIVPAMRAYRTLNRLGEMFTLMGDPDTWGERLIGGGARRIQERLGIAIDPTMPMKAVAAAIADRMIEEAVNTQMVDSKYTANVKKFMIGPEASKTDALKAAQQLQRELLSRVYDVTGVRIRAPEEGGAGAALTPPVAPAAPAVAPIGAAPAPPGRQPIPLEQQPSGAVVPGRPGRSGVPKGDVQGAINLYGGQSTEPLQGPAIPQGGALPPPAPEAAKPVVKPGQTLTPNNYDPAKPEQRKRLKMKW